MNRQSIAFSIVILCVLGTYLIQPSNAIVGFAQAEDNPWTSPINLSNSGSATNPSIVINADGITHVAWQDTFAGYVYSQLEAGKWSEPVIVELPFDEYVPILVSDSNGYIHAFWIDGEDKLIYSKVTSTAFGDSASWGKTVILAESVADYSVSYENPSNLHVAYIRNEDDSESAQLAGVYYLGSLDSGVEWSSPVAIDQSKYLRSASQPTANVQIASRKLVEADALYVVWDNPSLKRVFLSKSRDGGVTWTDPKVVDGPEINTRTINPYNITINTSGDDVLLIWQAGLQSGFACTQYYQYSDDGGDTWSELQVMLEQFVGCAQENRLFSTSGKFQLLQTVFNDEVYLLAWDKSKWSDPQPQSSLFSFTDSVTNDTVNFRCRQYALQNGNRLYAVGCDTVGDGDIWVLTRDVRNLASWFGPSNNWSKPSSITESDSEISSPEVILDDEGKPSVFWIQEERIGKESFHRAVYAASAAPDGWTQPMRVMTSPDNNVHQMAITSDSTGRVYLIWEGGNSGEIYFSTANLQDATSPTEWFDPVILPNTHDVGRSPSIVVDQAGTIHVAYVVPLNEGRGIYIIRSSDGGQTWSEPAQIFNAIDAGWQMVDKPELAISGDNTLHLIWTRDSITGNGGPIGLYYARSADGSAWTDPAEVVRQPIWMAKLQGSSDLVLHRIWMSMGLDGQMGTDLYHNTSSDNGENWNQATNLTKIGEIPGPFDLVSKFEITHLLQFIKQTEGEFVLSNLIWEDDQWVRQDGPHIGGSVEEINSISADIGTDGRLGAAFIAKKPEPTETEAPPLYELLYAEQSAPTDVKSTPTQADATRSATATSTEEFTPAPEAQVATPTVTSPSETRLTATPEPQLTPETTPTLISTVVVVPTLNNSENPEGTADTVSVLILAGTVAGLVVAIGILVTLIRSQR